MKSLTINFQEGDLPSLHPHDLLIYLRGIAATKLLFECLTRIDENGKVRLSGAEAVDVSQDRLRYIFTLRANRWSNGEPVTASHYEKAWKAALSPVSLCSRADLLYVVKNGEKARKGAVSLDSVGVKAVDEKTLVVDLEYPSGFFLDLVSQPICAPLLDLTEKNPSSFNGPFCLAIWKRNSSIKLKKNSFFWNQSRVSLDQIEILTMADPSTVFDAYQSDQVHWVGLPFSPLTTEQIRLLQKEKQLLSRSVDRSFFIHLNVTHPLLSSQLVRQALSMALDRGAITKSILVGGEPLHKTLANALLPVKMKSSSLLKEDTREAKLLFQQGLLELGVSKNALPPLTLAYSPQSNRKQFAEYLKETWKKVLDLDVRLEQQEWNTLRTNFVNGQFDMAGAFEASYYHDPMEILDRYGILNPGNFSQWKHPDYRQLLSFARREPDTETRFEVLGKAEEILLKEMPFIPVCTDRFLFAHRPDLKGYAFDSLGAVDLSYASIK